MIGIVLVTHGSLAQSLLEIVTHVVGPQAQIATLGVLPDDDVVIARARLTAAIRAVDSGDGVLLLTDIFGSTPSNVALSLRVEGRIEVLAGVNVPMLVKLAKTRRTLNLAECAELATLAGRKYIAAAYQLPPSCLQGGKSCEMVVNTTMSYVPPLSPHLGTRRQAAQ
ncbi:PTS sugar transporter subunit IIA [Swaminathania salitolerans]|uniref:PTS fructose transporter subunit IIA n=1 Tax=Swaminathania salitolerans TaxID=182838 RepID=A0A511BRV6_9PROT|nr:PTS sugar transporter subunit IIA [Swaminathania salitolerans]GBQ13569.1 PTS system transporter subunit IIA [Swaminathania salitolerans LMG 21291]GEL02354.1 PTS fructose transporter subunit IIA [Swaminathania salitolerans]